jgi:hypothetical protein
MIPQTGFLQILKGFVLAIALALGLASCGMSSNGMSSGGDTGAVNIGMTDAAGDFLTYTVDVTSLTLTKADGTVVQTLPRTTRIDFAQLVDLTEFITGATIPAGAYVSATLQLDYQTNPADIEVDDGTGKPVKAVSIVDAQGNPVTTISTTVRLDNAKRLVIAPGNPALFDLDFNLAASNSVTNVPAAPVVTVSPLLVGDVDLAAPKPHRVRGPLASVDTMNSSFTLVLRPFHLRAGDFGRVTFFTDSNTTFEIDQNTFTGAAGLAQLATESPLTAVVAIGTLDPASRRFIATEVLAGSSVPFGADDVVTGNVLSRGNNNTFVVKGAVLERSDGTLFFRDTVTVTVDPTTTKVRKQATMGAFATSDISVGQRITVFGQATVPALGTATLDATNGLARLLVTQLNGTVNGAPGAGGPVVMNLARIDGRPIALFDFAGTGTGTPPGGTDADPTAYQVATGPLLLTGIAAGTPLKVRGFVQPFGGATATDDFNAITLINTTGAPATLVLAWAPAQATPFTSYPSGGLVGNISGSFIADVFRGGVDTSLAANPTVNATDPAHGLFVIGVNGMVQVYTQMDAYQAALQSDLGVGKKAGSFVALGGTFDDPSNTLTAGVMATVLH